jgi:hypothetical protein
MLSPHTPGGAGGVNPPLLRPDQKRKDQPDGL